MDKTGRIVAVWRGFNLLQAQFLREALLEHNIDCYLEREAFQFEFGINDVGLWVAARDQSRARELIAEAEIEMRRDLEAEAGDESEE